MNPRMKKRIVIALAVLLLFASPGCAKKPLSEAGDPPKAALSDDSGLASTENPLPEEGVYSIELTMTGGSRLVSIWSPTLLTVHADGKATLAVIWRNDRYDYMLVNGERFEAEIDNGRSTFEIPVESLFCPLTVVADYIGGSTPEETECTITFDPASLCLAL